VGEKLRTAIRWLESVHAPLGRWTPLAASALFAVAGIFRSPFLRGLTHSGAIILAMLIAADIAGSLIDRQSFPDLSKHRGVPLTLPMLLFRILLTAIMGSIYTALIFGGIGAAMPFLFLLPLIFLGCCFVAWRNVSLWYEQGEEFEEALSEEESAQHRQMPQVFNSRPR
jgi:hypothetical protein